MRDFTQAMSPRQWRLYPHGRMAFEITEEELKKRFLTYPDDYTLSLEFEPMFGGGFMVALYYRDDNMIYPELILEDKIPVWPLLHGWGAPEPDGTYHEGDMVPPDMRSEWV